MDPLPFSKTKKIIFGFRFMMCLFAVSMFSEVYAKTEIYDLKEPGEVQLRSGNIVNFEKLCIDGYVYLYFKQLNTGSDGLTQIFITENGQKVPQACYIIK